MNCGKRWRLLALLAAFMVRPFPGLKVPAAQAFFNEAEGRIENLGELVGPAREFETIDEFLESVSLVADTDDLPDYDVLDAILERDGLTKVVATSREPLDVPGELVRRIPPLPSRSTMRRPFCFSVTRMRPSPPRSSTRSMTTAF